MKLTAPLPWRQSFYLTLATHHGTLKRLTGYHAKIVSLILSFFILTQVGCGFQLRGFQDTNLTSLETIALSFDNERLKPYWDYQLRKALLRSGTTLDSNASTKLNIKNIHTEKRTISYDRRGKAAEYHLNMQVQFELTMRNSATNQDVSHSGKIDRDRVFTFDPLNVSGKTQEERILKNELRREIIQEIMVQLSHFTQFNAASSLSPIHNDH